MSDYNDQFIPWKNKQRLEMSLPFPLIVYLTEK